MRAVDQHLSFGFERLGSRDIGEDHALFDEAMRIEPRRHGDTVDGAVAFQQQFSLRQIEVERRTLFARARQRGIGCP